MFRRSFLPITLVVAFLSILPFLRTGQAQPRPKVDIVAKATSVHHSDDVRIADAGKPQTTSAPDVVATASSTDAACVGATCAEQTDNDAAVIASQRAAARFAKSFLAAPVTMSLLPDSPTPFYAASINCDILYNQQHCSECDQRNSRGESCCEKADPCEVMCAKWHYDDKSGLRWCGG